VTALARFRRAVPSGATYLLLVLGAVVTLAPFLLSIMTALKSPRQFASQPVLSPPDPPTVANFTDLFGGRYDFVSPIVVTAQVVAVILVGQLLFSVFAAYAFARLRFRFRGPMFAFMIATIMLPHHAILIPQYIIFNKLGMVNTYWPLILPKFLATEAFFVFLIVQFMRGLPRELEEAARIDGCGPFRSFFQIVLPLTRPALITTAIFTFIWTWNDFFTQLIYLFDPDKFTLTLALRSFVDASSQSAFGPMFAMSVIALLPIVLFFLAFQRFLVEGMASSGLKG
jgi:multiple sugar transport system permease protein